MPRDYDPDCAACVWIEDGCPGIDRDLAHDHRLDAECRHGIPAATCAWCIAARRRLTARQRSAYLLEAQCWGDELASGASGVHKASVAGDPPYQLDHDFAHSEVMAPWVRAGVDVDRTSPAPNDRDWTPETIPPHGTVYGSRDGWIVRKVRYQGQGAQRKSRLTWQPDPARVRHQGESVNPGEGSRLRNTGFRAGYRSEYREQKLSG